LGLRHLNETSRRPDRVVVVGAGGFIGSAVAARLERDRIAVLRLDRNAVDLLSADGADRLSGQLRSGDVLVAAAAIAPCKTPIQLRDNMTLAFAIAQAAVQGSVSHLINISSDAVYADSIEPLNEASPRSPDSLHGVMHFAREALFSSAFSGPLTMLRPTLVYGAADPHNGYGPNRFRRLAAMGKPITLFGEGEERRDHVAIDDVAEIAARVIYRRSVGALNVATGTVASFREIAEMIAALSDHPVAIAGSPRSGPMPHNGYRAFDITACRTALPDFSYTRLKEGLAKSCREATVVPA
jgi:UDP-glucose 4-epimerase